MTEPPAPAHPPGDLVPPVAAEVPWVAPIEPPGPAPDLEFAPHGERFVAYLLDGLILVAVDILVFVPVFLLIPGLAVDGARPDGATLAVFMLATLALISVNVLYFPAFWANGGQTPGMRPFALRVVRDKDGQRFGWGTAGLRVLGLYVASAVFYLGFFWIFIDKRRRGWHDLIAGTVMIKPVKGR